MAANLRFATAIEVLALLASKPEMSHTSQTLATVLATNPVVIRRLLAELSKADMIVTVKGPSGGAKIARSAKQITLRDVYRALGSGDLLHQAENGSTEMQEFRRVIHGAFRKAQKSLEEELGSLTLHEVIKKASKKAEKHSARAKEQRSGSLPVQPSQSPT